MKKLFMVFFLQFVFHFCLIIDLLFKIYFDLIFFFFLFPSIFMKLKCNDYNKFGREKIENISRAIFFIQNIFFVEKVETIERRYSEEKLLRKYFWNRQYLK